ncbi:putative protein BRICK1 [Porites harrisoni]
MSSEVQQQIQQDWDNREFIEIVSEGIKKIAEFLNDFDMSCRSRLAKINDQLTSLEQRVEFIEARLLYFVFCRSQRVKLYHNILMLGALKSLQVTRNSIQRH